MESVFEANQNETQLIVFEDGNCFLMKNKSLADNHALQTKTEYKIINKETTIKYKKTKE